MRGLGLFLGLRRRGGSGIAPVNTVAPVVTGTGYVGQTLTTTNGTWTGSPAPSFTYQWQRAGADILGATASTYVMTLADEGLQIRCVVTATNAGGAASANSNAIRQWVPTDLGVSLEGWFDAYSPSTITIATGVSAWASRIGAGVGGTLSQATGALQPTYNATGFNGRPTVVFDYLAAQRLADTTSLGYLRSSTAGIIAAAARRDSGDANANAMFGVSTATGSQLRYGLTANTSGGNWRVGGRRLNTDANVQLDFGAFSLGSPAVVQSNQDYNAGQHYGRVNGSETSAARTFASGNGTTQAGDSARRVMGASVNNDGTEPFSGAISEVLVIENQNSAATRDLVDGYLAWRWGLQGNLPIGHTYKNAPPT